VNRTTATTLIIFLSALVSLQAASFSYDFDDGETDFTNTFSLNTGNMNYSGTGGVDGTGAVTPQGGSANNSALLSTGAGTFADNGNVLTSSLYFRPRDGNVNERIRVGYATTGGDFSTGDYISATVNGSGSVGANASLVIRGRQDGFGTIKFTDSDTFTLSSSNWYQLQTTFTRDTGVAGRFTFSITLNDWGTDGLTGGGVVDSYGGTIDGLNNVWNNDLFGGFQNSALNDGPAGSGGLAIDNFTAVIPEPGTFALVTLTGIALMMHRKRKS